jgi:hypothetical protein
MKQRIEAHVIGQSLRSFFCHENFFLRFISPRIYTPNLERSKLIALLFRVGLDLLPQTAQLNLDGAAEHSVLYPQIAQKFIAGKHHPGVGAEMF